MVGLKNWSGVCVAALLSAAAVPAYAQVAPQDDPSLAQPPPDTGEPAQTQPSGPVDAPQSVGPSGYGAAYPPPAAPGSPEARIEALEAQLAALLAQVQDLKTQNASGLRAVRADAAALPVVTLNNGRPTIATADGRNSVSIRGVVHFDAADYRQRTAGPLATDFRRGSVGDATEAARARDLGSGTNFRRARLGVEGKALSDFNYSLVYEFGGSGSEEGGRVQDLFVEYVGIKPLRFRLGAFSPGTGLEDAVSTNSSLFAERPAAADLVRSLAGGDGRTGAALYANGERWFAGLAFTGASTGNLNTANAFDEQRAFIGRLAWSGLRGEDWLVHFGVNTTQVADPADAGGPDAAGARYPLRLRERPELRVDGTRLVDTGGIDANGLSTYGLELGAQWRKLFVQAEYEKIEVERRRSTLSDPDFDGWYVQGGYTLVGGPRIYNRTTAGFDGPKIDKPFDLKSGDWGVVELAARWSVLDLDYQAGAPGSVSLADAIRGGRQRILAAGVNWYLNPIVRLMLQVQDVDVDRLSPGGTAFGAGALTPPAGAEIGQDYRSVNLRTQVAF